MYTTSADDNRCQSPKQGLIYLKLIRVKRQLKHSNVSRTLETGISELCFGNRDDYSLIIPKTTWAV